MLRLLVVAAVALLGASSADAAGWTAPSRLDGSVSSSALVTAPSGDAALVWVRKMGSGSELVASFRHGGDAAFGAPEVLASSADEALRLGDPAFGEDGALVVPYTEGFFNPGQSVEHLEVATRPAAGQAPAPEEITPSTSQFVDVTATEAADGTSIVAWVGGGYLDGPQDGKTYASVRDTGGGFLAPVALSAAYVPSQPGVRLVVDGSGNAQAVWTEESETYDTWLASAYRPAGGSWQPSTRVPGTEGETNHFDLTVAADGQATLVWAHHDGAIEVTDGHAGAWGQAARPFGSSGFGPFTLSGNPAGDVALGWNLPGTATSYGRSAFAVRRRNQDWTAPQGIGGCGDGERSVSIDQAGNVLALWDQRASDSISSTQVMAAVRPADGSWRAPQILTTLLPYYGASPTAALGPDGVGIASWLDFGQPNGDPTKPGSVFATVTDGRAVGVGEPATDAQLADAPSCTHPVPARPPRLRMDGRARRRAGHLRVVVHCLKGSACHGKIVLRRRHRAVGRRAFSLAAGRKKTLSIRVAGLPRAAQTVTAIATLSSAQGSPVVTRRAIRMRR